MVIYEFEGGSWAWVLGLSPICCLISLKVGL